MSRSLVTTGDGVGAPAPGNPAGSGTTLANGDDFESSFRRSFDRRAQRVRANLGLRRVLAGLVVGLCLGAVGATAAWRLRQGPARPWMAALGLAGALVGAVVAQRRRWNDGLVALYLDRKFDAHEAIATAVELAERGPRSDEEVRVAVLSRAEAALAATPRKGKRTWPRVLRLWHLVGPAAAGVIVWLSLVALPRLPLPPAPPPGSEAVQLGELRELDAVVRLSELDPRDEAQRQRLRELSDRAKELRRKLREGMPRREAQDEIAKLRDAVAAERARLGSGEQRAGLEAALGKLGKDPALDAAGRALGDRDLTRFDQEMERLANQLEDKDRDQAKKALEEAAKAARERGAQDVAKALEEQKRLLDERGKKSDKLKELAKAFGEGLSDDAKKALKGLEQSGSSRDAQKLSSELEKALAGLSDAERQRLAERLKEQAKQLDPETAEMFPLDKKQLEQMRKQLESPEGQQQLVDELNRMAAEPGPQSEESKRQQGLGEAEKGLGETQRRIGAGAVPVPGAPGKEGGGKGKPSPDGNGPQANGRAGKDAPGAGTGDEQDGAPGLTEGGGPGKHNGKSAPVATDPFRSKANAKLNPGRPMPGMVMGRTTSPGGETANKVGTGALETAAPSEVGAVEHGEIPEEYREQVGRYFQPD